MLVTLSIQNYILIDRLELQLGPGLNTITGETGAGKSILLGALGLLLGERSDNSVLRDKSANCIVEGIFDTSRYALADLFAELGIEYEQQTIIRRVISPSGRSRSYVNDLPVQQGQLRELGARLIDIHSQHQNLLVAGENFRRSILDAIAGNENLLEEYKGAYAEMRDAEKQLYELERTNDKARGEEHWLRHQVEELRSAKLDPDEVRTLEQRQAELAHATEIIESLQSALHQIDAEEEGILPRIKKAGQAMERIAEYYPDGSELASRLRTVAVEVKDIFYVISSACGTIAAEPEQLERINNRLSMLFTLQQKHKVSTLEELLQLQRDFEMQLHAVDSFEERIARLRADLASCRKKVEAAASALRIARTAAAEKLSGYVTDAMAGLGMPKCKFRVAVEEAEEYRPGGADRIDFLFSSNPAVQFRPMEKIASGGELSRLMLAIKSFAASSGEFPAIVFDEIDTGVSGRIADVMGDIIYGLSDTIQVINITHLPQVASKGDVHFRVNKISTDRGADTTITRLDAQERIEEISKMLSGTSVTDAARQQARILLGLN